MVPEQPRVSSAILVRWGDRFLLGKRNKENAQGKWVIPGGGIHWGETAEEAARRELREETGITVEKLYFLGHKEIVALAADYHAIVFFYLGEAQNPEGLQAKEDLSEAKFFTKEEIEQLDTVRSVKEVFQNFLARKNPKASEPIIYR